MTQNPELKNTTVLERVQRILADLFNLPVTAIEPQSSPETIARWDSLQHLNLVLALEQEFNLRFAPEEIEQLLSVALSTALVDQTLPAHQYQ